MPVYKDEERKTWYCSFYYTDWQGKRKLKKKRGFKTQREAKKFEKDFTAKSEQQIEMTFSSLEELYFEDLKNRIRETTLEPKKNLFKKHITPYFGNMKVSDITSGTIRHWQNEMLKKTRPNGSPYSKTTLRALNNQVKAIFNYAIKYQNLKENPCLRTEAIGETKAKEMNFWTVEEFNAAIPYEKKPNYHLCLMMLFWGGFRIGEVLALTPADLIEDKKAVNIKKTHHRRNGEDILGPTKSTNSDRIVELPKFVFEELNQFIESQYNLSKNDRIFYFQRTAVNKEFDRVIKKAGVKRIRIHDLRHSHVSLLIELGFSAHAIAKRIGDTVETVNRIYAHLYPHVGRTIAQTLDNLNNGMYGNNEQNQ